MENDFSIKKPYIGLRAFEVEEAEIFFGREKLVDELIEKLKINRFLAVVGISGYGKSSLVNAGLIDALYSGYMQLKYEWIVVKFRPSNNPIESLAKALLEHFPKEKRFEDDIEYLSIMLSKSPKALVDFFEENKDIFNKNILIVVDQFEEIFRYKSENKESKESKSNSFLFVDMLIYLINHSNLPIYSVITMRTDFLQECTDFEGLAKLISKSQFLIPKLLREEAKEAIEEPAKLFGWSIEPKLTTHILNELGSNTDQLPLMQHSLMRLWDNSKDNKEKVLKLRDYQKIGGFKDALSNHVDEIFNSFKDIKDKKLIEKIFKALTQIDFNNRAIRRALSLKELSNITGAKKEDILRVLKPFRKEGVNFITPFEGVEVRDDTIIDISHESLIRQWKLLKKWVKEENKSRELYLDLKRAAKKYENKEGELWRGADLKNALIWKEEQKPTHYWAGDSKEEFDKNIKYLEESQKAYDIKKRVFKASLVIGAFLVVLFLAFKFWKLKEEALKTRYEAEKLVDYILFDLRGKLEESGNLGALKESYDAVLNYYENLKNKENNPRINKKLIALYSSLGDYYSIQKNYKKAQNFYKKAIKNLQNLIKINPTNKNLKKELLSLYNKMGDITSLVEIEKGVDFYLKACKEGSMWGCYKAGLKYFKGDGSSQDLIRAKELFTKACDGGFIKGCYSLGELYLEGIGIEKSYSKALSLFEYSCKKGDSKSCNMIGKMYTTGKGVPLDLTKAKEYYEKSIELNKKLLTQQENKDLIQKENLAQNLKNMGDFYSNTNEFKKALEYYKRALEIYRELAKKNPSIYLPEVALTLNNLAIL
ncbi:MAG: SEL1-like repeat protein, partial [Epsilonproteobacteria bacterium]|nr:SEL1-like repeat protein [Campylobacterota bacterium]